MSADREVVQAALDNAAEATRRARDAAWNAGASGEGVPVAEVSQALDAMRDHRAALAVDGLPVSRHHDEVVALLCEATIDGESGTVTMAHMYCAAAAWLWSRGDA
jgi:hypothetical protein